MTNGKGALMASFMMKKKKYKFQVEICLEELLEVPFVSAVLFAKLRLVDGGNFEDHSSRQEVRDHKVQWNSSFVFPCKMMANASTGVMERCVLRISIRKESKGGRSFIKMGFVDLNLAEYAGAGLTHKKALLEGYDTRHRQDNSMLKFKIQLNMISGDILFKAPSPSLKHKQGTGEDVITEQRSDDFSGGSLAGSIASGSSGFGSLPKKRPALLTSDLVVGQTLSESHVPITVASDLGDQLLPVSDHPDVLQQPEVSCELGHSRNSSNTSQLSKASGYSSVHSYTHSRQSSSGDSGHIRDRHLRQLRTSTSNSSAFTRSHTGPKRANIPNTIHAERPRIPPIITPSPCNPDDTFEKFSTPIGAQSLNLSESSGDEFRTPDCSFRTDVFSKTFNELQKSASTSVVERIKNDMLCPVEENHERRSVPEPELNDKSRLSVEAGVVRSRSEFEIPRISPTPSVQKGNFTDRFFKSDSLFSFLTPRPKRKSLNGNQSTPGPNRPTNLFIIPASPIYKYPKSLPETRATSLSSLRSAIDGPSRHAERNPSAGSLIISETGSLDRAKAAYERRKKSQTQEDAAPGRVEITRVNPDDLIEELLKNTNLEQADDSAETSGLQLFIAKDGTAALGSHEVKSQMSTGAQSFKQVVMDNR